MTVVNKNIRDDKEITNTNKKKLSTNVLHDRFHRSDRALATIKAYDIWEDIYNTPRNDSMCTFCIIFH